MSLSNLLPTAVSIKKALLGQRSSMSFKVSPSSNPVEAMWQFLAGIYAKQETITKIETWNYTMIDGSTVTDMYNQVRAQYPDYIGPFHVASNLEWSRLQTAIDEVIAVMDPILYLKYIPENSAFQFTNAGFFRRLMVGNVPDTNLYGADGTVLATGIVSDNDYAIEWAQVKVPYDKTIGTFTPFISRLTGPSHDTYFRKTGSVYWKTVM